MTYVTPSPKPRKSTTLRTIIRPDSKTYESDSGVHVTFDSPENYNSKSDKHVGDASEKHESFATHPQIGSAVSSLKDKRNSQFFAPNSPPSFNVNHNSFPSSQPQHQPNSNNFNANFEAPPHHHRFAASQQVPNQEPLRNFHPSQPQPNFNQKQQIQSPYTQQQVQPQSHQHQQQQQLPFHHQQQHFRQQQPPAHPQNNRPPQNIPQQSFNPGNNNFVKFPTNAYSSNPYHHHQQQLPIKNAQNFHPQQNQQFNNFNSQPPQAQFQNIQQQPPHFAQQQQFKNRNPQHHVSSVNNNFINQQQPPIPEKQNHFQAGIKYQQPTTPPFNHHAHIPVAQKFTNEHVSSNVFQGGLHQQSAPNLLQQVHNKHEHQIAPQKNANSLIKQAFGGDIVQVQASETKFEHHVTEQLNAPVFIPSIDMDFTRNRPSHQQLQQAQRPIHHQQQHQQPQQQAQQQNHHNNIQFADHAFQSQRESGIFPRQKSNDVVDEKNQAHTANFDINNFKIPHQTTARNYPIPSSTIATTLSPVTKKLTTTTTASPPRRAPPAAIAQLPDEVPEDLREVRRLQTVFQLKFKLKIISNNHDYFQMFFSV